MDLNKIKIAKYTIKRKYLKIKEKKENLKENDFISVHKIIIVKLVIIF